jgi:RimJ/RimL family protein N-acetyltransferase
MCEMVASAISCDRIIQSLGTLELGDTRRMLVEHWPLFRLRVTTPRVELRYPTDDDAATLAEVGAAGVHDPAVMPFQVPWTDLAPPRLQRETLQYLWRTRASWAPDHWDLPMAVVVDDTIVGVQGVHAHDFPTLRAVETGSWLGASYQGKGLGTEMRAAILHLAFRGLGAHWAHTAAFDDNPASHAVTRKLGYEQDGTRRVLRRGEPAWQRTYRMSREQWECNQRDDIAIDGLEQCLDLFGLTP